MTDFVSRSTIMYSSKHHTNNTVLTAFFSVLLSAASICPADSPAQAPKVDSTASPPACELGEVLLGNRILNQAMVTRSAPAMSLGPLFSDGGSFAEKTVDEPCDPGKELGPFPVNAGGKLVARVTGSPPAPNTWSLGNWGTSLTITYEPQFSDVFGPGQKILTISVPSQETEVEGEAEWPGPGRLRAYIGPPMGKGPLSGSCFGQGYNVEAEIVEVSASAPLQPGMKIHNGDLITTGSAAGNAIISLVSGGVMSVGPGSELGVVVGGALATTGPAGIGDLALLSGGTGVNPALAGIDKLLSNTQPQTPDLEIDADTAARQFMSPQKIKEGTVDLETGEMPDHFDKDPEWRRKFRPLIDKFKKSGYHMPLNTTWSDYHDWTMAEAYDRVKDIEDPCLATLEFKLFMDSKQEEFTLNSALHLGVDIAGIWLPPNEYDLVNAVAAWAWNEIPVVGYFSTAKNILDTFTRFRKDYVNSAARDGAQWTLDAYEYSRGWTDQQVESKRAALQDQSERLISEIREARRIFEEDVKRREKEKDQKIKEIENASAARHEKLAKEALAGEKALEQELASLPEQEEDHHDIKDRLPYKEQRRREYWQAVSGKRAAEDIATNLEKTAIQVPYSLKQQGVANQYAQYVADHLKEITRLQTERNSLKTYRKPLIKGDCKSIKSAKAAPRGRASCATKLTGLALNKGVVHILSGALGAKGEVLGKVAVYFGLTGVGKWVATPDGTEFSVEKRDETAIVRVFDGEVTITAPDGQQIKVATGQQVALPGGVISDIDPASNKTGRVEGIPLDDLPLAGAAPEPYGVYVPDFKDNSLPPDWLWQTYYAPGAAEASQLQTPKQGELQVTVPNGNEFWGHRGDAPRLLHRATGDFDLEAELLLQSEGLNHAITEFVVFTPGSPLGYLEKQMNADGLKSQYLIVGGGWLGYQGLNKLTAFDHKFREGPDAPDTQVRFRMSRRGKVLKTYWSTDDGKTWTLSTRKELPLPETLWAGWLFKRTANDGLRDKPAVTTFRNVRLKTAPIDSMSDEPWDVVGFTGSINPLAYGWQFNHDPERTGVLRLNMATPFSGDFDAVARVDMGSAEAAAGQGFAVGLEALGDPEKDRAYILLGANHRHGQRYAADLQVDGTWGKYTWESTEDQQAWLRLTRKGGQITVSYWRSGKWVTLKRFSRSQEHELYLGLYSQTNWEASQPTPFAPIVELERLVTDDRVGGHYVPRGYSLMPELSGPEVPLPKGVSAHLHQAPFGVMNPFFDDDGSLYLLPAEKKQQVLLHLDPQGNSERYLEGEVFAGENWKRGAWQGSRLLVTVDGWHEGGNRLQGVFEVQPDGTHAKIPVKHGHGGLASISVEHDGSLLLSDFETDGVWRVAADGSETVLLKQNLPCAMDVAVNPSTGGVFVHNYAQGYTCGGDAGVYKIDDNGMPQLFYPAPENKNLGGMIWLNGGILPEGLYVSVPNQGQLLRVETDGNTEVILEGLEKPGALAATPSGERLAMLLGNSRVLLLQDDSPKQNEPPGDAEPVAAAAEKDNAQTRKMLQKAQAQWHEGELDKAIATLREAKALDPKSLKVAKTLKNAESQKEKLEAELRKAADLLEQGDFKEAETALARASRFNNQYSPYLEMKKILTRERSKTNE